MRDYVPPELRPNGGRIESIGLTSWQSANRACDDPSRIFEQIRRPKILVRLGLTVEDVRRLVKKFCRPKSQIS